MPPGGWARGRTAAAVVFLTGGTGFVGSRIARRLASTGRRVKALVRRAGEAEDLRSPLIEEVEGDFTSPETAARAALGADCVIHCAAARGE